MEDLDPQGEVVRQLRSLCRQLCRLPRWKSTEQWLRLLIWHMEPEHHIPSDIPNETQLTQVWIKLTEKLRLWEQDFIQRHDADPIFLQIHVGEAIGALHAYVFEELKEHPWQDFDHAVGQLANTLKDTILPPDLQNAIIAVSAVMFRLQNVKFVHLAEDVARPEWFQRQSPDSGFLHYPALVKNHGNEQYECLVLGDYVG